jgi:hypothetical protein
MKLRVTLVYASLGGIIGVLSEIMILAGEYVRNQDVILTHPIPWLISAGVALISSFVAAVLPRLEAVVPPSPGTPVQPPSSATVGVANPPPAA